MKRICILPIQTWIRRQSILSQAPDISCLPPVQSAIEMNEETLLVQNFDEENTHTNSDILYQSDSKKLIPKKKYALLMAYCGNKYHGMQVNLGSPDFPTIEGTLISALIKAGCVPEKYSSQIKPLHFQRCARTDKGVSAVSQLVSSRLLMSCSNPVEEINLHLPPDIQILGVKQVTKGFSSKNMCDARTYSYMLPTYALSDCAVTSPDPNFRLPREDFHRVNHILSFYRGSHNYHNFTSKKAPEDKSAWRHMFFVSCSEPSVHHGIEFASILFTGQSFMLHQIRKMVAMLIAISRGIVSADILLHCVQKDKISIPKAPGLGLVLECGHFGYYNRRYGADGLHEALTWGELLPLMEAFREEHINPVIIEGELEDLSMYFFIDKLKQHNFLSLINKS
ncbi:pseudouridylate synthase 1 homolog [Pelobates fuscus]|uniref:pseudouridylate synthase 1 homolog n=1 Tax=Pelobates fuscus TaxID=191477 RepID=UPI002FE445C1